MAGLCIKIYFNYCVAKKFSSFSILAWHNFELPLLSFRCCLFLHNLSSAGVVSRQAIPILKFALIMGEIYIFTLAMNCGTGVQISFQDALGPPSDPNMMKEISIPNQTLIVV